MTLVEVVILVGAQCLSPLQQGPRVTEAVKVPCAVLVRHDPETAAVEFVPPSAATDPAVVAMLVKPREAEQGGDITGSVGPARALAAPVVKPKPRLKAKPDAGSRRVKSVRRSDLCGAARAVWYTNKSGQRKYRCTRRG